MSKVFAYCLLPLFIACAIIFQLTNSISFNGFLFPSQQAVSSDSNTYYSNFSSNQSLEGTFLTNRNNQFTIYLLGSSELTNNNPASPYNFINNTSSSNLIAIGHEGNQCFSIFSQLLANEEKLKNAAISIIISPIWFQGTYANGTSSDLFLEYTTETFVDKIIHNDSVNEFKKFEVQRIAEYGKSLSSPYLQLKLLAYQGETDKNVFKKLVYKPVVYIDNNLLKLKYNITKRQNNISPSVTRKKLYPDSLYVNWDSLLMDSKKQALQSSNNNNWCIESNYYTSHVHGEQAKLRMRPINTIEEMKDFKMLIKLIAAKKANASFIILPMNPYYYSNINELNPIVDTITNAITQHNYPLLNLWETDTSKFDKGILSDVMHLSEYGWYKVDKFIADTYGLNSTNTH